MPPTYKIFTRRRHFLLCAVFLVAADGPYGSHRGYGSEGEQVGKYVGKSTTTDEHRANGTDKMVHGVDVGGGVGP